MFIELCSCEFCGIEFWYCLTAVKAYFLLYELLEDLYTYQQELNQWYMVNIFVLGPNKKRKSIHCGQIIRSIRQELEEAKWRGRMRCGHQSRDINCTVHVHKERGTMDYGSKPKRASL